jgi:uncharacterized beta barrel domain-containing protein DUF5777
LRRTICSFGSFVFLASVFAAPLFAADENDPSVRATRDSELAAELGILFVHDSTSKIIVEHGGKRYEVDVATQQIRDLSEPSQNEPSPQAAGTTAKQSTSSDNTSPPNTRKYYHPGDDLVFTLPSGRPIERNSWTVNFTHRFPYEAAFTGVARGATLAGLDDFSVSSFGLQYGITNELSVSAYRSPSDIGRPIELGIRYSFLNERHAAFNAAVRFSVDGQDNFSRNFTENFELLISRSLGHRAQLYAVPTFSLHNRPVLAATAALTEPPAYQPCSQPLANDVPASFGVHPCENTFSIGIGAAFDVRPTVALVGEIIPTAVNGAELGIHRVPFALGIQKKIYHHSFTFGLTTAPGTTVPQRIATRAIFLRSPDSDLPSDMFLGFDISRTFP